MKKIIFVFLVLFISLASYSQDTLKVDYLKDTYGIDGTKTTTIYATKNIKKINNNARKNNPRIRSRNIIIRKAN